MIINNVNGKDYRINFSYNSEDHDTKGNRKIVVCKVETVESGGRFNETGQQISESEAICNPKDKFNKSFGRKLALKRALNFVPKEERTKIWQGYLSETN